MPETFICPICGTEVEIDALSCPECGSDDETGWSTDTDYDGMFLMSDEPVSQSTLFNPAGRKIIGVIGLAVSSIFLWTLSGNIYLVLGLYGVLTAVYYFTQVRPQTGPETEKRLYQNLLLKARGDPRLVERWLDYEYDRNPNLDSPGLMRAAIDRWVHDNR